MTDEALPERFDIGITAGPDGLHWISAASRLGVVHGVPRTTESVRIGDVEEAAGRFHVAVAQGQGDDEAASVLGAALRTIVFDVSDVHALFNRTRGVAADRGASLLVRMLATPREIALLPWELLHDPEGGDHRYLTLASDADVVRLGRVRTYPVRMPQTPPPLRMLLVLSSPPVAASNGADLRFDIYEEKRSLLSALEPLTSQGYLEVDVEDRPTLKSVRDRVTRRQRGYQIVHYVGHAQAEGLLLEEGGSGRADLISPSTFVALLQGCPDLALMVFAGCQTAQSLQEDTLSAWPGELSLAEVCVRDVCPVVVGMQSLLPFATERVLTTVFYQALTSGRTVAESLKAARLAVRDDPWSGQDLLDWAVPCLFVGGESAGPMVDTSAPTKTVKARRRGELKFDFVEGDREFFARDVELRTAIDFLLKRTAARVLWVTGPPGVGKSRLVGRALDEVREATACTLYTPMGRLLQSQDPIRVLAEAVVEVFRDAGFDPTPRAKTWKGTQWWDRLLEEFEEPFVLALDEVDTASLDPKGEFAQAITRLAGRNTGARLVLIGPERVDAALGDQAGAAHEIALEPLGWPHVWRWIRRNRPVLTRYDAPALAEHFSSLGDRLDLWSRLADIVAERGEVKLSDVVAEIAPVVVPATPQQAERGKPEVADRGGGLLVACASPWYAGREHEFAQALTGLAFEHGVSGRVARTVEPESTAPIASLIPLQSPFDENGQGSEFAIMHWLQEAIEFPADVVVCDFGGTAPGEGSRHAYETFASHEVLVVAAGGNSREPTYPAWYPEVLAVGALDRDGSIAGYSYWDEESQKPDLFALEKLEGTALAGVLADPTQVGSSFAALHVAAAGILVWATDRNLKPTDVRTRLESTARPLPRGTRRRKAAGPRELDLAGALDQVRSDIVMRAVEKGPLEIEQLISACALSTPVVVRLVDKLTSRGTLRRTSASGTEAYELAS